MSISHLPGDFDLVIIGGGITGAGILREAVRTGLRSLLVEKQDFAQGTSSRSSKMVHGGLRYLRQGHPFLTRALVKERSRLLAEAPGLVEKMGFLWPIYQGGSPSRHELKIGLALYDLMAREKQHRYFPIGKFLLQAPHIRQDQLIGGYQFYDARVDDARLVMRLINEAVDQGGFAENYVMAEKIVRDSHGTVAGVSVADTETGKVKTIYTPVVINATGWWAESLHPCPVKGLHMRPLRGSHIVLSSRILPAPQAVAFAHPADRRPFFVIPWEGATLVGTTDLDHKEAPWTEPAMSREELDYLMEGLRDVYPSLKIRESEIIASFAGVRAVLSQGEKDPSQESREHVLWVDKGLVTVTGGKLTSFRLLALDALKAAKPFMRHFVHPNGRQPIFAPVPSTKPEVDHGLSASAWRRLFGRYGLKAPQLVQEALPGSLSPVGETETLFAELPFAVKTEKIRHLNDLLLRRTRLGLLIPKGAAAFLDRIQELCAPFLSWDKNRWDKERNAYLKTVEKVYSIPA